MISASRLKVRRAGFETSRRQNAQAIETRTITATTFCIAEIAAQSAPSNGIDRTVSISPPVTMFAVPIVSRTKPQKIPACMSPARQSWNIFVWTNAYSISPANRAPIWPSGAGWAAAGVVAAKTRRWRAIARTKIDRRSPEEREDERVSGDVGEDREGHSCSSGSTTTRGSATGRVGGRGRSSARRPRRVVERPGERLERVVEDRDDRLERLQRAPVGLPGRLTMRLPPRTPATARLRSASGVVAPTGRAHRLGEARHLVVDDGERRLGRHVARRQAGAAGRDDERVASRRRP